MRKPWKTQIVRISVPAPRPQRQPTELRVRPKAAPLTQLHDCDAQTDYSRSVITIRKYGRDWLLLHSDSHVALTVTHCPFCGVELK